MADINAEPRNEVELDTDDVKEESISVEQKQEEHPSTLTKEEVDLGYTEVTKPTEEKEEVKVEEKKEEVIEEKKDNLKKQDSDFQKRINELVYKQKEAERREKAALNYAKGLKKKYDSLEKKSDETSKNYLSEYDARVDSETERQKKMLKEAIEAQDADKIAEANAAIAKLAVEKEKVNVSKAAQPKNSEEKEQKQEESGETPPPPVSQKAADWATKNSWFGTDRVMTNAAMSIHEDLLAEGVASDSDEYYTNINERMKEYFPQKFAQSTTEEKPVATKPVQNVASVSRRQGGRKSVKLTKSQVVIAKKLGVPLEEYAKYVKEGE